MRMRHLLSALALAGVLAGGVSAAEKETKKLGSFGVMQTLAPETAKAQAEAWLKEVGKTDAATLKDFQALWSSDRPVIDLVAETLTLGDAAAAKLLTEARDEAVPVPKEETPAALKDAKKSAFYRSNLALAYAKALSNRRDYESTLEVLKSVKPEQVVDPGAYLFHKAVAEHALLLKDDATRSIIRLVDDVTDAPDRYKLVATLMYLDMQTWQAKDLREIAGKMSNIERRLDLARGGPKTQKLQKDVLARLDEIIKKLENQKKGSACNGGGCPNGGQPGQPNGGTPNSPQTDSVGGQNTGPGKVDEKVLKQIAEIWGKLPEKERAQKMAELTRSMPSRYREVIENYFKKTAEAQRQP